MNRSVDRERLLHELQTHKIELELQNEELRRAEVRLKQAARRYGDLYDFAPVGYLTLTRRAIIREINLKGAATLGRDRIILIGAPFFDFIHDGYHQVFHRHISQLVQDNERQSCKLRLKTRTDEPLYAQIDSIPWVDDETGEVLIRSILSDITQQTSIEAELIRAKDKAEQANLAKSQFMANISHEMRTPLAVILGYGDLLAAEAQDDPMIRGSLSAIRRNGEHLLQVIDDILDISRIEGGQLVVSLAACDPRQEIQHILDAMRERVAEKQLALSVSWQKKLPPRILTDGNHLRQILSSVLDNAIKFTNEGSVTLDVSTVTGSNFEGPFALQIDVSDSGCGIAASQMDSLFQPFSQIDASNSRKFNGLGVGLYLARRLAQALGGDVTLLQSEPGVGSTFRVRINLRVIQEGQFLAAPQKAMTVRPNELEGTRILLAEDSPENQLMIRSMIEMAGGTVYCADDGVNAVSLALEKPVDLILMDLQLPLLDGYQATAELRKHHFNKPVLALTAHAFHEDRQRVLQSADFDGFLTKPIGFQPLVDILKKWIGRECPVPLPTAQGTGSGVVTGDLVVDH